MAICIVNNKNKGKLFFSHKLSICFVKDIVIISNCEPSILYRIVFSVSSHPYILLSPLLLNRSTFQRYESELTAVSSPHIRKVHLAQVPVLPLLLVSLTQTMCHGGEVVSGVADRLRGPPYLEGM